MIKAKKSKSRLLTAIIFTSLLGMLGVFVAAQEGENNSALSVQRLFFGEFDNTKYSLTLENPEGISEFIINKAGGDFIWGGEPSCAESITSDTVTLNPEDFPLTGYIIDCLNEGGQNDIGASMPPLPVISGHKFYDINGIDGRSEDEPGIGNWIIALIDGEGSTALYETGAESGYQFILPSAGTYTICESAYPNWTQTYPTAETEGSVGCDELGYAPRGWSVIVDDHGELITDSGLFDFGNTPKLGDITVVKFNDLNSNGVRDDRELGIEGIEFRLNDRGLADGFLQQLYDQLLPQDFNRFAVTNIDGIAEWTRRLPAGRYEVEEQGTEENWIATTDDAPDVALNPAERETEQVAVGNRRPALVVYKYDNEEGGAIPGWEICLYKAEQIFDEDGEPALNDEDEEIFSAEEKIDCQKTINDEDGQFHGAAVFSSEFLEPGYYIIDEEEREGWKLENADGDYDVVYENLGQILARFDESSFEDEDIEFYFYNSFTGITGYKWNDLNGDGIRNWEDNNENGEKDENEEYAEPGLPGWTIVLSDEAGGDIREDVTDPDGNYYFFGLNDADYNACEVKKSGDWTQTYPNNDTEAGDDYDIYDECGEDSEDYAKYGYEVSISEGTNISNLNFGSREIARIIIRKETYPRSDDEFGFAVNKGDEELEGFSLFGGDERVLDVVPGSYTISEIAPENWKLAHVACEYDGESVGVREENGETVTIGAGDTVSCTFTNIAADLTIITGYKWEDLDGDGEKDEGEPGRKDWNVALGRSTIPIEIVALSLTGADGWYYLPVSEQGNYKVFEEKRGGWMTTNPPAIDSFFDIEYRIDLEPQQKPLVLDSFFDVFVELEGLLDEPGQTIVEDARGNPLNFGNFELVDITGLKWNDEDGDGLRDEEEPGFEDVIVALGRHGKPMRHNNDETIIIPIEIIAMSLTGADGGFTLRDVGPGRYKLFEENKSRWQATHPISRAAVDSFFDITYNLDAIAIGDPDFDLLRISPGDPDFDLLRSSFFDVFVELSGQNVNQSQATIDELVTVPSVPLEFGNHQQPLVLSEEETRDVGETSMVITWTTDFPATSRVIYDTVSHPELGTSVCSAPRNDLNCYGYANTTPVLDTDPKVIDHSVSLAGLTSGTTYYYRTISSASPETVSDEGTVITASPPTAIAYFFQGSGENSGGGEWTPPPPAEPAGEFIPPAASEETSIPSTVEQTESLHESAPVAENENQAFLESTQVAPAEPITETVNQEAEPAEATAVAEQTSAPQPTAPSYLLASIGDIVTLGTDKIIVGALVVALILGIIGYGAYTVLRHKPKKLK